MRTPLRPRFRTAMPMLPSRNYVSDHTKFIRELIEARARFDWIAGADLCKMG